MDQYKKRKIQAAWILLGFPFLFSQDWVWEIIKCVVRFFGDVEEVNRSAIAVSTSAALLFCLFSVVLSSNLKIVKGWLACHATTDKKIEKLCNKVYKVAIILYYRYFDIILKTDSTRQIEEKFDDFLKEPKLHRMVASPIIVIILIGFMEYVFLLFNIIPNIVKCFSLVVKSFTNIILFLFLMLEIHLMIKCENSKE